MNLAFIFLPLFWLLNDEPLGYQNELTGWKQSNEHAVFFS